MKYFTEFGNELISECISSICFCLFILQDFLQILLASLYSTDFEPNCLRISCFCCICCTLPGVIQSLYIPNTFFDASLTADLM